MYKIQHVQQKHGHSYSILKTHWHNTAKLFKVDIKCITTPVTCLISCLEKHCSSFSDANSKNVFLCGTRPKNVFLWV